MPVLGVSKQVQARLGRYELLARLASGGMGEIFLARLEGAEGFEKLYVVKRILAHLADDARIRQMLVAEARIASKMSHSNICQVFELGETDGQLYIVMEYLEGVSLLLLLRRFSRENTPLDLGFVTGVLHQVNGAMNYAHGLKDRDGEVLGIIHRDITPSNIFLTETGVAKVLDFGIAKARGASTQTQEGTVKGKYAYMAPEQLKGKAIDHRVDIFALGVVLYEMLALRRLFHRKTDYLTFRAVMEQPISDIRRYRPDLPEGVVDALARALDRDRNARFNTARQFDTAILDGLGGTRPWTQGEIGDFIRDNFADAIGKRSKQVASVVARTQSGHANSRARMPLVIQPNEGDDEEEDDDFPPVETEVEGAPPWMPRPTPRPMPVAGNEVDVRSDGTPPPFGAEGTGSAPSLQPLQPLAAPTQTQIVVAPKRSLFWPIIGVAMVAITAGALFLVWQQVQKPQQPAEIKITQEPATKPAQPTGNIAPVNPEPLPQVNMNAGSNVGSNAGSNATVEVQRKTDLPKAKTFQQQLTSALSSQLRDLKSCINEYPETREIIASIAITSSGKAKSVSLQPADIDAGPLGACLKNVLARTAFPSGHEASFSVPLKPRGG